MVHHRTHHYCDKESDDNTRIAKGVDRRIALRVLIGGIAFSGGDARARAAQGQGEPAVPLRSLAQRCGIRIGASEIRRHLLRDAAYRNRILRECSILTAGLELKWDRLRPTPETYDFSSADWMVDFAESNKLLFRGHNLAWHQALPKWFPSVVTARNARNYLEQHISTVVGRYSGRIYSWDVVNEPVRVLDRRKDGLKEQPWVSLLGPDYISIAFHAAAAADPRAQLVLNEVNLEFDHDESEQKRQSVITLLRSLKMSGVPVQALGLESHLRADTPFGGQGFTRFISEVRDLGIDILVTEMDIDDTSLTGPARDELVAKSYYEYLHLLNALAKPKTIVFWQFSDYDNWYDTTPSQSFKRADNGPHRPGLLDDSFKDKPAYRAVRKALQDLDCS
jgi:endo-1,4-beta-xylanase